MPTPALTLDPTDAYPELVGLRVAMRDHDWPGLQGALAGLAPDARTRLIRFTADTEGAEEFATERVEADRADTLAAGMLGTCLIERAWHVRTGAVARYVSQEQFDEFHALLRQAEQVLIEATAHEPTDPAVWVDRLITARGLSLGQAEARRRYDRLAELDPHHLSGQTQLLQQLCPKWGGSFDEAHAFARTAMLAAGEGAPNGVLVAEAHLEQLLALKAEKRWDYRQDRKVRDEIREAALHSVQHPDFRQTVGWVGVRNTFALMLVLVGERDAAVTEFEAIGPLVTKLPWGYFGDPLTVFTEYRDRLVSKVGAW